MQRSTPQSTQWSTGGADGPNPLVPRDRPANLSRACMPDRYPFVPSDIQCRRAGSAAASQAIGVLPTNCAPPCHLMPLDLPWPTPQTVGLIRFQYVIFAELQFRFSQCPLPLPCHCALLDPPAETRLNGMSDNDFGFSKVKTFKIILIWLVNRGDLSGAPSHELSSTSQSARSPPPALPSCPLLPYKKQMNPCYLAKNSTPKQQSATVSHWCFV
jgi:hypothetical protein